MFSHSFDGSWMAVTMLIQALGFASLASVALGAADSEHDLAAQQLYPTSDPSSPSATLGLPEILSVAGIPDVPPTLASFIATNSAVASAVSADLLPGPGAAHSSAAAAVDSVFSSILDPYYATIGAEGTGMQTAQDPYETYVTEGSDATATDSAQETDTEVLGESAEPTAAAPTVTATASPGFSDNGTSTGAMWTPTIPSRNASIATNPGLVAINSAGVRTAGKTSSAGITITSSWMFSGAVLAAGILGAAIVL
jgi:hypothetical protein